VLEYRNSWKINFPDSRTGAATRGSLSFHTSSLALEALLTLLGNKKAYKLGARISAGCHHNSPQILVSAYVGFIALIFVIPNHFSG